MIVRMQCPNCREWVAEFGGDDCPECGKPFLGERTADAICLDCGQPMKWYPDDDLTICDDCMAVIMADVDANLAAVRTELRDMP